MMYPFGSYDYFAWSPLYSLLSLVVFAFAVFCGYKAVVNRKDKKWLWLCIALIILLFMFPGSVGFGLMGFGIGMLLMPVFMILFWGVVIWLIFVFVKSLLGKTGGRSALEILKARYARGEISKKQYGKMKKELR